MTLLTSATIKNLFNVKIPHRDKWKIPHFSQKSAKHISKELIIKKCAGVRSESTPRRTEQYIYMTKKPFSCIEKVKTIYLPQSTFLFKTVAIQ